MSNRPLSTTRSPVLTGSLPQNLTLKLGSGFTIWGSELRVEGVFVRRQQYHADRCTTQNTTSMRDQIAFFRPLTCTGDRPQVRA